MTQNHLRGFSSRRVWLRYAGVGASMAVVPLKATSRAEERKDNAVQDIKHLIRIHKAPQEVYDAITTADDLRQWWTRDASIEARVGSAGEFGFNGKRFVAKVAVEDLTPAKSVRWKVTNGAWPGNDIEFKLKADGSDTVLFFAHRGFPPGDEAVGSATMRWGFYLLSLKRYLQTGKGTPNPEDSEGLG